MFQNKHYRLLGIACFHTHAPQNLVCTAARIPTGFSSYSTGVSYTRFFIYPRSNKFRGVKTGDRSGQGVGPLGPNHFSPYLRSRCSRTAREKCAVCHDDGATSPNVVSMANLLTTSAVHLLLLYASRCGSNMMAHPRTFHLPSANISTAHKVKIG